MVRSHSFYPIELRDHSTAENLVRRVCEFCHFGAVFDGITEEVVEGVEALVCKTTIRRFESDPRRNLEGHSVSWHFRSCLHQHPTLIEAAKCAMPHCCGWYVIAVQGGAARELTEEENKIVNEFRFGTH